jgi:hypothetical protein
VVQSGLLGLIVNLQNVALQKINPSLTCSRGIVNLVRLLKTNCPPWTVPVNFNGWKYSRAGRICKAGIRPPEEYRDDVSGVTRWRHEVEGRLFRRGGLFQFSLELASSALHGDLAL